MAETKKNEVATKNTTALSWWTNELTNMVTQDYADCGIEIDEYSKTCAMAAMTSIFQLVKNSGVDIKTMDTSNLREIVGQCASLKLNANAVPRECYFQMRSKNIGNKQTGDVWIKVVEMGIEGDGYDSLLSNFGRNVEYVYPYWIVKEGDEFIPPKHKGIEITPPEWEEKGLSQKAVKVVYPVRLTDGSITYLIADRDGVKVNLLAHVKQNMMNETFGICKDRYKATEQEKAKIKAEKEKILKALRECETVEDMLKCEIAIPFISGAWIDTPESMIQRKMRNNAVSKFPKKLDPMAKKSILQLDETYQQVQSEIAENANQVDFVPVDEPQAIEQQPEKLEPVKEKKADDLPDFMKAEGVKQHDSI